MKLQVEELEPGMRVAEPVHNAQNILLIKGGTDLTEKRILTLKTWGVTHVVVEGRDTDEELPDIGSEKEAYERIEKRLKNKFTGVLEDPVMAEIMKRAIIQIQKREG